MLGLAVWRREHIKRQPEADHTASPLRRHPTCIHPSSWDSGNALVATRGQCANRSCPRHAWHEACHESDNISKCTRLPACNAHAALLYSVSLTLLAELSYTQMQCTMPWHAVHMTHNVARPDCAAKSLSRCDMTCPRRCATLCCALC